MSLETTIVDRQPVAYVAVRERIPMERFTRLADQLPDLIGWVLDNGGRPTDAPFFRYHQMSPDVLDVEAGVPAELPDDLVPPGAAFRGELPGGRYVRVVHVGHPDGLPDTTREFLERAAEAGLEFDMTRDGGTERWTARLESYRSNPREVPIDRWEVELAIKLADA